MVDRHADDDANVITVGDFAQNARYGLAHTADAGDAVGIGGGDGRVEAEGVPGTVQVGADSYRLDRLGLDAF